MKNRGFKPSEILFAPTHRCNLHCDHCDIRQSPEVLDTKRALEFLRAAAAAGIKRVGFTGGEPFLAINFLTALSRAVVAAKLHFSRITTNAVWFKNKKELPAALKRLHTAGYDGDIGVSLDAFHRQDLKKVAAFINNVAKIWRRPEMISLLVVKGARDGESFGRLKQLAVLLGARLVQTPAHTYLKSEKLFIRVAYVELAAIGRGAFLKNAWDGRWFKDDFCKGPGNVLFVLPDGRVSPCCGYANDADLLNLGSIKTDTPQQIIKNALNNRFVQTVFTAGLHPLRLALEKADVCSPGETSSHCVLCHYFTQIVPRETLEKHLK